MTNKQCFKCKEAPGRTIDFTMAFQPIVDIAEDRIWGYEALVRGPNGASAKSVLEQLDEHNRYWFDQTCRVKAIEMAAELFPTETHLSINFMPNSVYEPRACIRTTLDTSRRTGFDSQYLMFEFTEDEQITDHDHIKNIIASYKKMGFLTAIDDFGAGYAGLNLLAKLQPDIVKVDMDLIRNVDHDDTKRAILKGLNLTASELGITLLAEGVETEAEMIALRAMGIHLFQGYLLAPPKVEALPELAFTSW